ncbi:uncharacterized protein E0L32_005162 [Thyridium curvatum]|uniref:Uncharacterized protein n=1 Tax=Thyridium curvatum TaxID=1093900 RepID=A0A507B4U0_9PEZI|nr:uncharacterized protein E0L32_005162 [Thyridium curvatum]TPX14767.1 hypothetical protein E0L32_005162 [Thyridium curvatum]
MGKTKTPKGRCLKCGTKTTQSCFICGHGFFCSEKCVSTSTTLHQQIHHQGLPSNTAHDLKEAVFYHELLVPASEAHRDYRFCDIDDETQRLQLYVVYEQVFRAAGWCSHLVDKWRKEKVLGDKACGHYERSLDILSRDWACASRRFLNGEDVEYTKVTEPVVSSDQDEDDSDDQEEDDSDDNDESEDEKMDNSDKEMDISVDDNAN